MLASVSQEAGLILKNQAPHPHPLLPLSARPRVAHQTPRLFTLEGCWKLPNLPLSVALQSPCSWGPWPPPRTLLLSSPGSERLWCKAPPTPAPPPGAKLHSIPKARPSLCLSAPAGSTALERAGKSSPPLVRRG